MINNNYNIISCRGKIYFVTLASVFLSILFLFSFAYAADPGHGAAVIGSGTFEGGNYVFPSNLSVNGSVGIGTIIPGAKLDVAGNLKFGADGNGGLTNFQLSLNTVQVMQ